MDPLAPPQRQQPSSSLPSLPTEIIHRIIQLALPRPSFDTFKERYDTLLDLCRVNKLWRELAQRELVRHLRVVKRGEEAFQQTIDALPVDRCVATRSLWVTNVMGAGPIKDMEVAQSMAGLTNLLDLSVAALHSEVEDLDLQALSEAAPGIQTLHLEDITLRPQLDVPDSFQFRNLRHLSLTLRRPAVITAILSIADLPHLESLLLFLFTAETMKHVAAALEAALVTHAPRLLSFGVASMDGWSLKLPLSVWSRFTQLKDLLINSQEDISDILVHLPASLTYLRVFAPDGWDYTLTPLVDALNATTPAIASLRKLVIASLPESPESASQWEELQHEHQQVRGWCQRSRVELVEEPVRGFDYHLEGLQDLLDLWDHA